MKLRLWEGITVWAISSLAWAFYCYTVNPPFAFTIGICIGAMAMILGLWWRQLRDWYWNRGGWAMLFSVVVIIAFLVWTSKP